MLACERRVLVKAAERLDTRSCGPEQYFPLNLPFALQPTSSQLESRPLEDDLESCVWNATDWSIEQRSVQLVFSMRTDGQHLKDSGGDC